MKRYLEYEEAGGRILCEIYAEEQPQVADGHGALEIAGDMILDTNNCAVRDGVVVRLYETPEEIRERERLRQEYHERAQARIRHLIYDFMIAMVENDKAKQKELRAEYAQLKSKLI